jgi:glycosyltransferase involved in cell wall biosynthesis
MTRVLIYAQVPPPLHGQSVMVQLLVDGLRETGQVDLARGTDGTEKAGIAFVHINPQIASDLADIGRWRLGKILSVFKFVFAALRARFRYGLNTFYFVPAPPKREALYRDWAVLLLCRPFFSKLVLHWHCIGQREFFAKKLNALERGLGHLCYDRATVSIALSKYSEEETSMFRPKKSVVVPNGIPDPCPKFEEEVWPEREKRQRSRIGWDDQNGVAPATPYEVLFMAGRMTPKGLFDAMAAVAKANESLVARNSLRRMQLTVAGPFGDDVERAGYEASAKRIEAWRLPGSAEPLSVYAGWADEAKKRALYRAADCFIFPTTYPSESFGLVLAEAMAYGCAVITTRWQAVPEVLPPGDPNVVEPHDIEGLAAALLRCAQQPATRELREYFLAKFTSGRFVRDMVRVLGEV